MLRLGQSKADLAKDVYQVWQLLVVRSVQGEVDDAAHVTDDPFAAASGEGQGVVAAADGVVDRGVVQGESGDCCHDADELAAAEDGVLAAGAAHAGAGEGRVGVIAMVLKAREGIFDGRRDLEWTGAGFALLVEHDSIDCRVWCYDFV